MTGRDAPSHMAFALQCLLEDDVDVFKKRFVENRDFARWTDQVESREENSKGLYSGFCTGNPNAKLVDVNPKQVLSVFDNYQVPESDASRVQHYVIRDTHGLALDTLITFRRFVELLSQGHLWLGVVPSGPSPKDRVVKQASIPKKICSFLEKQHKKDMRQIGKGVDMYPYDNTKRKRPEKETAADERGDDPEFPTRHELRLAFAPAVAATECLESYLEATSADGRLPEYALTECAGELVSISTKLGRLCETAQALSEKGGGAEQMTDTVAVVMCKKLCKYMGANERAVASLWSGVQMYHQEEENLLECLTNEYKSKHARDVLEMIQLDKSISPSVKNAVLQATARFTDYKTDKAFVKELTNQVGKRKLFDIITRLQPRG